jgi:integrase/recombinase XerD
MVTRTTANYPLSVDLLPAAAAPADFSDRLRALVLDSVASGASKRAYARGLTEFFAWFSAQPLTTGFSKATVQAFKSQLVVSGLSPSTVNLRLTAVRRLAAEAADNGWLAPEAASAIGRVKGVRREGRRLGNWLPVHLAERLVNAADAATLKGKRDRALLALLLGCGLRREETAALTLEHIQQREGRWVLVDLVGKGGRIRSVPMPAWAKAAIRCLDRGGGLLFRTRLLAGE